MVPVRTRAEARAVVWSVMRVVALSTLVAVVIPLSVLGVRHVMQAKIAGRPLNLRAEPPYGMCPIGQALAWHWVDVDAALGEWTCEVPVTYREITTSGTITLNSTVAVCHEATQIASISSAGVVTCAPFSYTASAYDRRQSTIAILCTPPLSIPGLWHSKMPRAYCLWLHSPFG